MFSLVLGWFTYFASAMSFSNYQIAPLSDVEVAKKRLVRDLVHLSAFHLVFMVVRWVFFRREFMGFPVIDEEFIGASVVDIGFTASLLILSFYFNRA